MIKIISAMIGCILICLSIILGTLAVTQLSVKDYVIVKIMALITVLLVAILVILVFQVCDKNEEIVSENATISEELAKRNSEIDGLYDELHYYKRSMK